MEISLDVHARVTIDKESLMNAISNALYCEYLKRKRLGDLTLDDFSDYLPSIIADEIIGDIHDIIVSK